MAPMIGSEMIQAGYRYACSLTHNGPNAEDLVQDACFKLFKKHGRIENKSLFFVTIRNLFIDRYRRERIVSFEPLDERMGNETTEEAIDHEFTVEELEKALETLRPEEREVIYLNYYERCTAREIGDITGRPRNTILSLLHRGKKKLAVELKRISALPEDTAEPHEDTHE